MSLHMITHAVMFAVIATLVKKYLQLLYQMHALEDECFYRNLKSQNEDSSIEFVHIKENNTFHTRGTCQSSVHQQKVCHFQNICFLPKEDTFVYFYSRGDNFVQYFLNGNGLSLSSPVDFNGHNVKLTFITENMTSNFSIHWIHEKSYISSRFKGDNLMHVLHDDLMPLYFTMKNFENMKSSFRTAIVKFDAQLVFMDDWVIDDYKKLYNTLTSKEPLLKENLIRLTKNADKQQKRGLICFSSATVGLLQDTLWYNYGFIKPQGPIYESSISAQNILSFRNFISHHLGINQCVHCQSDYMVLISRKENRKILNENDLVEKISQGFGIKVVIIGSETHAVEDMISLVVNSKGLIGMHGSLLTLLMFLLPGSFVIELFPYAVPAKQYTPYKTLANMEGMELIYSSWENLDSKASVGHPEYIQEHGGLRHLLHDERMEIIAQKTIPKHLCCEDPSWLYHIYQDTIVDIPAVMGLMKSAMDEGRSVHTVENSHIPAAVKALQCQVSKSRYCELYISWQEPWNVEFLQYKKLQYEVIVQDIDSDASVKYITEKLLLEVTNNIDCDKMSYTVWTRPVLDDYSNGEYVSKICI